MPVGAAVVVVIGLGGWMALNRAVAAHRQQREDRLLSRKWPLRRLRCHGPPDRSDPNAQQLQDLLGPAEAKSGGLAGGAPSMSLPDLARADQIQRLQRQSQASRRRGTTETVSTRITGFKISALTRAGRRRWQ